MSPEGSNEKVINEKEALEQAQEQGIYFVDEFAIVKLSDTSNPVASGFKSRADAEDELKKKYNNEEYTISQTRRQVAN